MRWWRGGLGVGRLTSSRYKDVVVEGGPGGREVDLLQVHGCGGGGGSGGREVNLLQVHGCSGGEGAWG